MKLVLFFVAFSSLLCLTSCGPSIGLMKPIPSEADMRTGDSVSVVSSNIYNSEAKSVENAVEKQIVQDGVFNLMYDPSGADFVVEIQNAYLDKKGEHRTENSLRKDFNLVADVKVINNRSGSVSFVRTYRPSFSKRKNWSCNNVSYHDDAVPYHKVASDFSRSITPHTERYWVSITPNKANPLVEQSSQLANQGHWSEASIMAQKALNVNHQEAEAYFIIAICQREQGDFKTAVKTFNKAISIEPKSKYVTELDRTASINHNRQFM